MLGGLLGVVAGILAVGGVAKLRGPDATVPMLRALGLPASPMLARALGLVEVGVGVAAFLVGGWALAAAVALLFVIFTVAVLRLRSGGEAVSCGCFGRSSAPPTLIHAVVDGVAALVAVAAAVTDAPGFLSMRPDLPAAGVPQLGLTVLAVWLGVALLTVLPEALVAARRVPATEAQRTARALRTFSLESPAPMSPSAQLADKVSGLLGSRFSRRGFFARTAVVGSAVAANPLTYALTPTDAYAAVCSCSGSNCDCGSTCCDGYTEFCCTISGKNQCPPGALLGGWWKVDGSGFCNGPRYYMDCNAPCNGCGCGGGGICSGSAGCANTTCGCALGDCNNRKAGCVNFRYGQCNQQVSCIGPIICRVVTCIAPWEIDGTCTTTARYDAATANHDRPCLHKVIGDVNTATETTLNGAPAIRVTGWAIDFDTNASIDVHVYVDGNYATRATASVPRSDVAIANPGQGPNHGFDVTIPTTSGVHNVCVYGINSGPVGNGNPAIGCATVKVGSPFGNFEGFSTGPSQVTVRGWAADPDTTGPVSVHVYVDGNWAGQGVADQSRPDVGQAFPALGPNHGYTVTVPLAAGSHSVCVYAINVGNGSVNTQLGCATVIGGNPFGSLDAATATAGGVDVSGWAIDPDQLGGPIDVQLRLDGNPVATVSAGGSRPDVGSVYPSAGANHGFSQTIAAAAGVHTVSAVALNVGPGTNQVLATRSVEVRSGSPFGNLEHTWTGPNTIRIQGWVLDPDDTGPVQVQVEVDGVVVTTATANVSRPDVAAVYPGYGPVRGFLVDVPATNGLRLVRVVALNVGAGSPVVLGVRQLQVGGNPFGNFEDVVVLYGRVAVAGWALDPDVATATDVHVFIDGKFALAGTANQSRPDVASAFPLYGPNHGFSISTPITKGRHEVCVFAINQGPGTENVLIGCKVVTA